MRDEQVSWRAHVGKGRHVTRKGQVERLGAKGDYDEGFSYVRCDDGKLYVVASSALIKENNDAGQG